MNQSKHLFKTWEEVISDFLKKKHDTDEEKYLKDELKKVEKLYRREEFFNNEAIELAFNTRKNKKEDDESALEFHQKRAVTLLKQSEDKIPDDINIYSCLMAYAKQRKSLNEKYLPYNWLSRYCENASSVSFATHVAKLTHSKIDTPSVFDSIDEINDSYVTTSALAVKAIDGAVAGNQFSPIFQFLELELNGKKLAEQLPNNKQIFKPFVKEGEENGELLEKWINGFKKALDSGTPATHTLAKQIYFPVSSVKLKYHLLCNIVSSSLAHSIYERIFDDNQKPVKKVFEKRKFFTSGRIIFPQRSNLNVTASNHSNASQLNGKRGGKLHLFSSQPPTWKSQLKPPIYKQSLFSGLYNATIKIEIDYLRDFLLRFKQLDLSIKDPKRRHHLERWVNNIIDEFLFYVAFIQNLPAGWSDMEGIRLKKAHQYLLDPYRRDESFQSARQNEDWKKVIRDDFANWLNRQLRGKDKQFTPKVEHSRLWKKLLEQPLREHIEQTEQEVKQKMGAAV